MTVFFTLFSFRFTQLINPIGIAAVITWIIRFQGEGGLMETFKTTLIYGVRRQWKVFTAKFWCRRFFLLHVPFLTLTLCILRSTKVCHCRSTARQRDLLDTFVCRSTAMCIDAACINGWKGFGLAHQTSKVGHGRFADVKVRKTCVALGSTALPRSRNCAAPKNSWKHFLLRESTSTSLWVSWSSAQAPHDFEAATTRRFSNFLRWGMKISRRWSFDGRNSVATAAAGRSDAECSAASAE